MPFYLDTNFNLWHFFVRGLNFFPFKFVLNGQEISPTQDIKVVWLLFYCISRPWICIKIKWKRLVSRHKYFAFEHEEVWSQIVQTNHFATLCLLVDWPLALDTEFCNNSLIWSTQWLSIFPCSTSWAGYSLETGFQKV